MPTGLSNVSRRLINWFVYNFWFAFFPLTASVTLHYLGGKALRGALVSSPEILFFVIMTGATALGNLSESESIRAVGWGLWVMVLRALLLCGAISATFLYGILLYPKGHNNMRALLDQLRKRYESDC